MSHDRRTELPAPLPHRPHGPDQPRAEQEQRGGFGDWAGYADDGLRPGQGEGVSSDSRLLMVKLDQRKPSPATEMTLVQNWFEELKATVPVKR